MDRFAQMVKNAQVSKSRHVSPFGQISSIAPGGKLTNVQNVAKGETRDLRNVQPYGISSCGLSGLYIQTAVTDNNNNVAVGVYDPKKPSCVPGEIIIYSVSGASIRVGADHTITASASGIGALSMGAPAKDAPVGGAGVHLVCALGSSQLKLDEAGNIELSNPVATIGASVGGDIQITGPAASITIDAGGNIIVDGTSVAINSSGGINLTAAGDINLECGKANYNGKEIETK